MSCPINFKIRRIASGGQPRVLDLFSGCGGISLGFERAGFKIVGGVDSDLHAALTHMNAFHRKIVGEHISCALDVTDDPGVTLSRIGIDVPEREIDVLVGGPPCQAFARVGRAKLREISGDPHAYISDPRVGLYRSYLEYVGRVRPLALFIENVPDLMNFGGRNVAEEIAAVLRGEFGYRVSYTLLNSAWYGVPQMRERCILVAVDDRIPDTFRFPEPQNYLELPKGYGMARGRARRRQNDLFDDHSSYVETLEPGPWLPPAVSVADALADLPAIAEHLEGDHRRGRRPVDDPVRYREDVEASAFAEQMRCWPGHEAGGQTDGHVTRSLPRDYPIFAAMEEGDDYPAAHRVAERLFLEHLGRLGQESSAIPPPSGSPAWEALRAKFVPPYDPGKFPNKWWKLRRDMPSRTLMAHIGKDTYSHIHYDGAQARTITVREAARLQSFPDGFGFSGSMNSAFRQIGNAVPPLLAACVAERIMLSLQEASASLTSSMAAAE